MDDAGWNVLLYTAAIVLAVAVLTCVVVIAVAMKLFGDEPDESRPAWRCCRVVFHAAAKLILLAGGTLLLSLYMLDHISIGLMLGLMVGVLYLCSRGFD